MRKSLILKENYIFDIGYVFCRFLKDWEWFVFGVKVGFGWSFDFKLVEY